MFMWNPQFCSPVLIKPINCVLVKGVAVEEAINQSRGSPGESSLGMTLTEHTHNSKERSYISKWNILFDRTFSQWISFKPKEDVKVYPCYSCRDMFGSKNSFLDHINRRGMLIKYTCPFCSPGDEMTFYNPCSFLLHAREHYSNTSGEINLDNVTITVIPIGLAGFFQHPDIPLIYNVEEDNVGETRTLNTRFYAPNENSEGRRIVTLKPLFLLFYQPSSGSTDAQRGENTPACDVERLVLKQLSSNIPCCKFVPFTGNTIINESQIPSNNDGGRVVVKQERLSDGESEEYTGESSLEAEQSEESSSTVPLSQCLECKVKQKTSMSEHFMGLNKPLDEKLKCGLCRYIAATQCSLAAHARIHSAAKPFICPECGKEFFDYTDLMEHLDYVCFHLVKHVRYRCPGKNCSKIFASPVTFASHFNIHFYLQFKCRMCCSITTTEKGFNEHNDEAHESNATFDKLYKCSICKDKPWLNRYTFEEHTNGHCTDVKLRVYVFTCKFCKNYFRSRETYAVHLVKCSKKQSESIKQIEEFSQKHPRGGVAVTQKLVGAPKPELVPPKKTVFVFNCQYCNGLFKSRVIYNAHVAQCNKRDPLEIKLEDYNSDEERAESTNDTDATLKIKGETMVNCVLCNERCSILEIRNHLREKKCKPQSPPAGTGDCTSDSDSPTKNGASRKRRKNFAPLQNKRKSSVVDNLDEEEDLRPEEPIVFNGEYACKFCDYTEVDRRLFQEHIVRHRDVLTSYQCMECGECFVVRPSLEKHLNFVHQILDTEKYFEENECFDEEAVKKLEDAMRRKSTDEPVGENQCKVCRQQFDDEFELSKHFRVHGMAFLMKSLK